MEGTCNACVLPLNKDENETLSPNDTSLVYAAAKGKLSCVKELIAAGADVNNSGTVSPLISAIRGENTECVKELLEAGVDVNVTDGGDTALLVACQSGNEAIVKLLIEFGADVNAENSDGMTALYLAVSLGHAEYKRAQPKKEAKEPPGEVNIRFSAYTNMVFLLLKAGSQIKETSSGLNPCTVHLQPGYSDNPNVHILRILSAAGANIGQTSCLTLDNSLKSLIRNCIRNHLKQIHPESNHYITFPKLGLPLQLRSYLLFDTPPRDYQGLNNDEKEFLLKASKGYDENVLNLIEAGVDVNIQDENGMTALMMACKGGCVPLVEQLIRVGADVNIQNIFGDTALICGTLKRQNECVKKLLEFGADTSIQGKNGFTALMHAAKTGNINCLQTLIDSGADPNIPNYDETVTKIMRVDGHDIRCGIKGNTSITYAAYHGKVDCVKKLIEAGADVNRRNQSQSNTPLTAAIEKESVQCLKVLIQGGADFNITHKKKITALVMASGCKKDNCFSELIKAGAEANSTFLGGIARDLLALEDTAGRQNK